MPKTYASITLLGTEDLETRVDQVESVGIVPCVTAVCGECGKMSLVLYEGVADPYVHALAMYERLVEHLGER